MAFLFFQITCTPLGNQQINPQAIKKYSHPYPRIKSFL
ncbi:hypothetical protein M23134_04983 [Microscilla marina ATCC 23134]|uniref:Uncharacterized protein n=1 Tax=Microscilla marina ATCC 23134 TaxID=313606 RepID=A1ZXH6_MICM2|nr:hypothetical protein M23134_04983 [Microscilla marina ATCC 23134]